MSNKTIMKIAVANLILYTIIFGLFMRKLDNDDLRSFRSVRQQHRRNDNLNLNNEDKE